MWRGATLLVGCASFLFVAGCAVVGDRSLDFSDNRLAVTPLPADFYIAPIDADGNSTASSPDQLKIYEVQQKGDAYAINNGRAIHLAPLNDQDDSYIAQVYLGDGNVPSYFFIRLAGSALTAWIPTDAQQVAIALRGERAAVTFNNSGQVLFSSKDELINGFHIFDRVPRGFLARTFRIASADQLSSLQAAVSRATQPQPPPAPQPARDAAGFLQFDGGGYNNTVMLDQFYGSYLEGVDVDKVSEYVQAFVERMKHEDDCIFTISDEAYGIVYSRAAAYLGLGGLIKEREHEQNSPQPNVDPFTQGMNEAQAVFKYATDGAADANVFYDRYGCYTPVAHRIFNSMQAWALSVK